MRQVSFSYPAADGNAIAATQNITTSTGGYVVLNGDYAFYPAGVRGFAAPYAAVPGGVQRTIGVFSTGTLTAVVFYASGLDTNGRVVTASFAGASGGSSAATDSFATFTAEFAQVNAIFCTSAATSLFTVGVGATGSTRWVMSDTWKTPFSVAVTVVTATGRSVTVQSTQDDPNVATSPTTFDHATGAMTANTNTTGYSLPVRFIRGVVTTGTGALLASSNTTVSLQQSG